MPIYEYQCNACGHEDSSLESIKAPQSKTCPQCHKKRGFKRLISAAGFQLKGQGWYATDFKDKKKPVAEKTTSDQDGKASGDNKDSKADNKADQTKTAESNKTDTAEKAVSSTTTSKKSD